MIRRFRISNLLGAGAAFGLAAAVWVLASPPALSDSHEKAEQALPAVGAQPPGFSADAIPNARPGQCFAKVLEPARVDTVEDKVVAREASHRLDITDPKYGLTEDRVEVKQASFKLEVVPAVFEDVQETIELEPARLVWRTGKGTKVALADPALIAAATQLGVPPTAKPGECFAEYAEAPTFEDVEEKVLVRAATKKLEVTAPEYEIAEEKVLVKEASEKIVEVPAVYETVTEKVLVSPATTQWKRGRGPIERVDHGTGEIMCLVEIPAVYKEVKKRVLKTPATTKRIPISAEYKTVKVRRLKTPAQTKEIDVPAEYKTITKRVQKTPGSAGWRTVGTTGSGKASGRQICRAEIPARTMKITKRVVKTPATTRKVEIPAESLTVKVQKVTAPAQEKRIEVPAEYQIVKRSKQVSSERLAWREVLCETNASPTLVTDIQRALDKAGFDPGAIDGVLGRQTLAAVESFQRSKNLGRGGLTLATLEALGVSTRQ